LSYKLEVGERRSLASRYTLTTGPLGLSTHACMACKLHLHHQSVSRVDGDDPLRLYIVFAVANSSQLSFGDDAGSSERLT